MLAHLPYLWSAGEVCWNDLGMPSLQSGRHPTCFLKSLGLL